MSSDVCPTPLDTPSYPQCLQQVKKIPVYERTKIKAINFDDGFVLDGFKLLEGKSTLTIPLFF